MKKTNLKNILVAGLIITTSTFAFANHSNEKSFIGGVIAGAILSNAFTTDKYADRPVYVYNDRYYYGGDYRNGYYNHNGVRLYGGKYYNQSRLNNYRNHIVSINDRYNNSPVYVYNGRYYYGGKYKHGYYYFKNYRLSGGKYYYQPRTYYKHKIGYNNTTDRYNQNTRSYNDDRYNDRDDNRYYDRNDRRDRNYWFIGQIVQ